MVKLKFSNSKLTENFLQKNKWKKIPTKEYMQKIKFSIYVEARPLRFLSMSKSNIPGLEK